MKPVTINIAISLLLVVLLCNAAERSTSDAVVPEDWHGDVQHGLSKADQAVLHKYTHGADARATIVSMPQVPPRMPGGATRDDSGSEVPPPMPIPRAHTADDEKARNVAAKSAADAEAAKTAKKEAAIEAAEEKAAQQEAKKETGHASTYKPTPFAEWPEYAKRCVQEYGGYACKPPENAGGCIGCDPGELYGAYTKCSDQYISDACDYGPRNCGSSVCFDPKIAAALRNDKSIILSALQMSSIAYLSQDDKATTERFCPGIHEAFPLHHHSFDDFKTKIKWGMAHRSFGQRGAENLYAVVFRGTSMEDADTFATNWLVNLKLYGEELDGAIVHAGFLHALQPHMALLLGELQKPSESHTRLLIAGHSLGGGLANVFAYLVKKKFPKLKVELVTAGAPRVGDYKFASRLEQMMSFIYRVNAWCDPIPRTPTDVMVGLGTATMVHAGPQVTVGADYECWKDPMKVLTVAAHSITLYIKRVRNEIEGNDDSLCKDGEQEAVVEADKLKAHANMSETTNATLANSPGMLIDVSSLFFPFEKPFDDELSHSLPEDLEAPSAGSAPQR